ncbi:MAG: hypothetical protein QNK92_01110 [Amylibacter sp.]
MPDSFPYDYWAKATIFQGKSQGNYAELFEFRTVSLRGCVLLTFPMGGGIPEGAIGLGNCLVARNADIIELGIGQGFQLFALIREANKSEELCKIAASGGRCCAKRR